MHAVNTGIAMPRTIDPPTHREMAKPSLAEAWGGGVAVFLGSQSMDMDSVCRCSPYLSIPGYLQPEDYSSIEIPPTKINQTCLLDPAA